MACDRFADAISARAHGSPLGADAAAHLAICTECRTALETEERVLALIDAALEEIASTCPPLNFVARIRAHVEHAPRWTPSDWWIPAAAAAIALLAAAVIIDRSPGVHPAVRDASASRPAGDPVVAPTETADLPLGAPGREPKRVARARRRAVPEPARLATMPEVLVPQQQREAVSRLFASLRAGRPEVVSMLMSLDAAGSGGGSHGVVIEPLRIEPVVVSALPSSASISDK